MGITLSTYPTYKHEGKSAFDKKTAIIIDVLRATSTIVAALDAGCIDVLPVKHLGDGIAMRNELDDGIKAYLCGEVNGVKPEGYDYGNSPSEFEGADISGSHMILRTTNGTQAIAKAEYSSLMLMGCINNAFAVAEAAAEAGRDIVILCSGSDLKFAVDDIVTAGMIIEHLISIDTQMDMDDLSCTALYLYQSNRDRLKSFISYTRPYKILMDLDMECDIDYCLKANISDTVPYYRLGRVVPMER